MAVLPSAEDVGPVPDSTPRRIGVGRWNPSVISSAADAAGQGLQNLGASLVNVAAQQQDAQNQLEVAQARGTAAAAEISGHAALPTITDPNQLPAIQQSFTDARDAALSRITNPRVRALTEAEMLPQEARLGAAITARGNAINNDQQIATYEQNTNTTITSAATIDNDEASQHGLDSVNRNIDGLIKGGTITAVEGQTYRQRAVNGYISARERYLEDIARQTGDTSRLEDFVAANRMPGAGVPAPGPMDAPAQRIAAYQKPIEAAASKYGVSPDFLAKTAYIESKGDPNADNGFARGLMQFSDGTAAQYGVAQKDPNSSIDGAARYAADNRAVLTAALGRPPTDAELYLAHQQDGKGAAALLTHPDTPAGQLVNPKAIIANGGDPSAPARQFTEMWAKEYNQAPSFASGTPAAFPGLPPAPTRAPAPNASNSYFIGDSVSDGLKGAAKAPGDTVVGRSPEHVLDAIDDADPADLQGKTIYLSTGASNAPDATTMVHAQLAALKEKGVAMANVRVIGVGDRKDFVDAKVNDQLAAIAKSEGAVFAGPLDPSNLAKDRVHPADYQKALTQVAGANAMNAGAPLPPREGVDPSKYPILPPLPAGATHFALNQDGTFSSVSTDGTRTPVPGIRPTGTPDAGLPDHPTGSIIDHLPPQDRAEMVLHVHNVIDQINLAKERAANQRDTRTSAAIKNAETQMIAGQTVSPAFRAGIRSQAMASLDPAIPEQYARFDAAAYAIDQMKGMNPTTMHAFVDDLQGKYSQMAATAEPGDAQFSLLGAQLQAATHYEKVFQAEIAKDPLGRALKENVLPNGITPITPASSAQDIEQRVADAQTVANHYNLTTPQFLTAPERIGLRELSTAGGQPLVSFAQNVVAGAGNAAGPFFKQMHGDAGFLKTIGGLASMGAPQETLDDAAKYKAAMNDPDARKNLLNIKPGDMTAAAIAPPLGDAANGFDFDARGRIGEMASLLAGAEAMRLNITDKKQMTQEMFDNAYNKALGATIQGDGTRYGGIADIGGSWFGGRSGQKTIAPQNIKATDFGKVIDSLNNDDIKRMTSQPLGQDGKVMEAEKLKSAYLTATPDRSDGLFHGRYTATMGNPTDAGARPVLDARGKPWVLDMSQLEDVFRQRFPGAYLGVTPERMDRRARSAVAPYGRVPGLTPVSTESEAPPPESEAPTIPQEGS